MDRNRILCLFLLFAVTSSIPGQASENDHYIFGKDASGKNHVIFALPKCLPNCDASDMHTLTELGVMEDAIRNVIANGRQQIVFSQFTFSRHPIFEELLAAYERGVVIRGIMDHRQFSSLHNYCNYDGCTLPSPFNSPTYIAGTLRERLHIAKNTTLYKRASLSEKLAILLFKSPNGSGVRPMSRSRLVHHKFVLADGQFLASGSGNWSSTAVSVNLENLLLLASSTNATRINAYSCAFDAMWGDPQTRAHRLGECQTNEVYFTPISQSAKSVVDEVIETIAASQLTIDITMHHLVHPAIILELEKAASRGVKIRLLTDDDHCVGKIERELRSLLSMDNVERRFVQTSCQIFQLSHNKFGVFDSRKLINGSGNWSRAGLERNFENFISTTNATEVSIFSGAFEEFWALAVPRDTCTCKPRNSACRARYCLGRAQ